MKIWKSVTLVAPVVVALSVLPGSAHAQRGGGPCRDDIQKFCKDIEPGGGRYRVCLEQHASDLSPACQEHLKNVKGRMAAWRQACESDVKKFCSSITPGRGSIAKCLRQHESDLSQTCKDQLAQRRHRGRAPAAAPGQ